MKKKSVLILRSNDVSPDPRVEKVAKTLAHSNYKVKIISWGRRNCLKEGFIFTEVNKIIPIKRIRIPAEYGMGKKNIVPMFKWQIALFLELLKKRMDYHIIHACDFDTVLPALIMKFIFRKKVVYDIFDFYVDSFSVPSKMKGIIKKLDFFAIRHSDVVILVDEKRWEQIKEVTPKKVFYIYNSPDATIENDIESSDLIQWPLKIGYVGILNEHRFLSQIMNIVSRNSSMELHIAGFGPLEKIVEKKSAEYSNIMYYGRVDYKTALNIYKQCDVIIAIYDPSIPNHKYSSPNKLFEAMMLGKPIIVANGTGIDEIVRKHDIGFVVDYYDITSVEKILLKIRDNKQLISSIKDRTRKVYLEQYSWDIMKKRLLCLYDQL